MRSLYWDAVACVVTYLMLASPALGQEATSATVVGVVRDTSGAVLPGVTVEVTSPALIERVKTSTTDSDGRYRVVDLRPGIYAVTFTLPGFRSVRREGLELTTGFTATVNGELAVGAVQETVTVTGAAPIVDVRSAGQQQLVTGESLRTLPIGKNSGIYVAIIPGAVQASLANQDVGGTKGETTQSFAVHGGHTNESFFFRDGLFVGTHFGQGGSYESSVNPATLQETGIQLTGGLTAESMGGGVQMNLVSRDGGNTFHGSVLSDYGNRHLQGNNVSDALRARGVTTPAYLRRLFDVAGGVGGPLRRDRIWFFAGARNWESSSFAPGNYYNKLKNSLFYERDLSRPAYDKVLAQEISLRLTVQINQKHRVSATSRFEHNCNCMFGLQAGTFSPEAAGSDWVLPNRQTFGNWTYTPTNRLLVQVGMADVWGLVKHGPSDEADYATNGIAVLNQATNYFYGSPDRGLTLPTSLGHLRYDQHNVTGSVSYVTGAHNFKVGGLFLHAADDRITGLNRGLTYTFAGTVPQSVTYYATPLVYKTRTTQTALFAQEQWTSNRLTLNLGLRYDGQSGHVPPTEMPAGAFVGARSFGEVKNVPNWKDMLPRLGFALDLFGTGRTAIKGTLGKFVAWNSNGGGIVALAAPPNTIVASATRVWTDVNGDYVPQESELGPLSNALFGQSVAPNTVYSDDVLTGWGHRGYNWQGSVSVQHQLLPGVGVSVGYFRTSYGNFLVTDNLRVGPSDFDSYCATAPTDPRLPGGGGERICGLLDVKPALFGQVFNQVNLSSKYGDQSEVYNGFDVTTNVRFGASGFLAGGLATARTVTDNCEIVAQVPELVTATTAVPSRFCKVTPPWSAATQVKLSASYELPYAIRTSVNYQHIPGVATTAQYVVPGTDSAAGLGRTPSAGARATALVELIKPNTLYREKSLNQVNLAFSRAFKMGTSRLQPRIELDNVLNANTVTQMTTRYGAAWQNVSNVLGPRLIKFGVQYDF